MYTEMTMTLGFLFSWLFFVTFFFFFFFLSFVSLRLLLRQAFLSQVI